MLDDNLTLTLRLVYDFIDRLSGILGLGILIRSEEIIL
jgi:hypothetical protein